MQKAQEMKAAQLEKSKLEQELKAKQMQEEQIRIATEKMQVRSWSCM